MTNMCCPHCGCKNIQVTTETDVSTTGKNYSVGKGCLGYLMFGPLGFLCGSCGEGQKTTSTSTTLWICPNCGHKFASPNDIRKEARNQKDSSIVAAVMGIIMPIIGVSVLGIFGSGGAFKESPDWFVPFILGVVIVGGIMCILASISKRKLSKNLLRGADDMEAKMRRFNTRVDSAGVSVSENYEKTQGKQIVYKYCVVCGAELPMNATFCSACGSRTENISAVSQTNSQAETAPFNKSSVESNPIIKETTVLNNIPRAPQGSAGPNEWKCPNCGIVNQNYVGTCGCGTRRP